MRYGLMWDDPAWYWQSVAPPVLRALLPLPTFQFYRPFTILLNRSLVSAQGVVNVRLAHGIQIAAHLVAVLVSVPALQVMGFSRRESLCAAAILAAHPFSHQAVAWQAPQQPMALALVLLAFLSAARYSERRARVALAVSVVLYVAALLIQESAAPLSLLFLWPAHRDRRVWRKLQQRIWPLLHVALAGVFMLVWLMAPRRGGIVGGGLQPEVMVYLIQGVVYPFARAIAALRIDISPLPLGALLIAAWLALVLCTWKRDRASSGLKASLLMLLGIAPVWVGLSWPYVKLGSRLLYPATLGIGALWGRCMAWPRLAEPRRRYAGLAVSAILLALAVGQWGRFTRLYNVGLAHLAQTVELMAARSGERLLLVNYPDRLEIRPRLYPLGFWGLTLAPEAEPLSDYALATYGTSAETRSVSAFAVGFASREQFAYRVDLRGSDIGAEALFEGSQWADALYLTTYTSSDVLSLDYVGAVQDDDGRSYGVRFGDAAELLESRVMLLGEAPPQASVDLLWRARQPFQAEDTIFLHVLTETGQYVTGADGDAAAGLLPLRAWIPSRLVADRRWVSLDGLPPGRYVVTVGLYNRVSGERYAAFTAQGERVAMDEVPIHRFGLP
ncbi:MAG: hypothetical protein JXA74_02225 [Anaerolineae bacterium]|nr:hypothetical protein [Anaerolineae bacterium]